MITSKAKLRAIGFIVTGIVILTTWALYVWMGKDTATNVTLIGAGAIVALRAAMFRWPSYRDRYYASMKRQGLMVPKFHSFCWLVTVPCMIGLMVAGWWVCFFATLIWLVNFEYDFRVVQADRSVNATV